MNAGTEFAFWALLFAQIGAVCVVYEVANLVMKLRRARREIVRLTTERNRFEAWLFYKSDSPRSRCPANT